MKIGIKLLSILLAISLLLGACANNPYQKYQAEFMGLFDTVTVIVGYAQSQDEFNSYAQAIYNRLAELNRLFNIYTAYQDTNNIYTINQYAGIEAVKVNREIIDLLLFAQKGYRLTDGTVNVAMGSVLALWHDYREAGILNKDTAQLPPMDMLNKAAALTNINDIIIDEENNTVFLKTPGMCLDVGAVAKGYAAGLAAKAAADMGACSLLLNVGGNITAIGRPMDNVRARWGIGIQDPRLSINKNQNTVDTVYFNDATVSCSGDYQRFYIVNQKRYNHIIDPLTLMPAHLYQQVVVIHPDAAMADLLSTALFILPPGEGANLLANNGGEALWVYLDGSQQATPGYAKISKNMGNYTAVD